ncbi:MAG TPA: sulfatase-like hydrolase/transferase [Steroidobacteraceae bacterium]|nr:sulfatase-like hydrolase/transferase [Steroidobacteraceae bacterium]
MSRSQRRRFLVSLGSGMAFVAMARGAAAAAASRQRPNILFILADDLGFADLSCYGRRDYQTPVLDELAAEGVRFTQAYSNSPVCSATRVALATGRYQYRLATGLEEPINARTTGDASGLSPAHPTLPSMLRTAGYRTALIGKWHLGALPGYSPLKSGYDQFFGIAGGAADYVSHTAPPRDTPDLYDGERLTEANGYLTDVLSDKAVEYVRDARRHDAPFLLSLHYTAPHWPWQAPGDTPTPKDRALFHFEGGSLDVYARMVRSMDTGIGRVLAALRATKLDRSTLVVFTSDNGGERFSDNWPLSGQKLDLLEGGIRVPQIVRWKGELPAGSVTDQVMVSMDWVPTLLTLGRGAADAGYPLDGIDLSALLQGARRVERRTLHWRMNYRNQAATRSGDWKYLRIGSSEFLFDLATDARERANRRKDEPERFAALKSQWESWNAQMLPLPTAPARYFNGSDLAGYYDTPPQ